MRDHTRRSVAYVFGRLAGHASGAVYDPALRSWVNMAGDVDRNGVHVYDYWRNAHLSGSPTLGGGLELVDHGDGARVRLSLRTSGWCVGYDQQTNSHIEVRARGREVEVFDLETRQFHVYSV
jgi:hypothetical protein